METDTDSPPTPPEARTVHEAIQAVQAGDTEAYAEVVAAYQRRLRAAVAVKCPPGVDPDEIAHMAFVESYKRIDQFQPGTDFYVWVWVFARHLLMAEMTRIKRRAHNRENYAAEVVVDTLETSLGDDPDDALPQLQALRHCLHNLPEQARTLVQMRYNPEFSLIKAAKALGKTVSAIKFQLFSIRKALKECVEKNLPSMEVL